MFVLEVVGRFPLVSAWFPTLPALFKGLRFCGGLSVDRTLLVNG